MSTIVERIKARSEFFDLWQGLGQRLANNPKSWNSFQQEITRPESDTSQQVTQALKRIEAANQNL